jgi:hypothetical protein
MKQARRVVSALIGYLGEISTMPLEVEVETIEPQQVFSIMRSLTVEHLSPTIIQV